MLATPERSLEQRKDALKRANEIRTVRAAWKRAVKHEGKDPLPVLLNPPREFETMKAFDFLLACPKLGRVKVNGTLHAARVSPSKTLAGLSDRQRAELVAEIRGRLR